MPPAAPVMKTVLSATGYLDMSDSLWVAGADQGLQEEAEDGSACLL